MQRQVILTLALVTGLGLSACADRPGRNDITGPGVPTASLQTLVDNTTGLDVTSGGTGTWNWAGQSFVVPGSGSFGDLRFHDPRAHLDELLVVCAIDAARRAHHGFPVVADHRFHERHFELGSGHAGHPI